MAKAAAATVTPRSDKREGRGNIKTGRPQIQEDAVRPPSQPRAPAHDAHCVRRHLFSSCPRHWVTCSRTHPYLVRLGLQFKVVVRFRNNLLKSGDVFSKYLNFNVFIKINK